MRSYKSFSHEKAGVIDVFVTIWWRRFFCSLFTLASSVAGLQRRLRTGKPLYARNQVYDSASRRRFWVSHPKYSSVEAIPAPLVVAHLVKHLKTAPFVARSPLSFLFSGKPTENCTSNFWKRRNGTKSERKASICDTNRQSRSPAFQWFAFCRRGLESLRVTQRQRWTSTTCLTETDRKAPERG